MTAKQITDMINAIWEGVENSKVGNMILKEKNEEGFPVYNNLSYNTFLTLVSLIFPKNLSGNMGMELKEPNEPWKGDK